MVCGDSPPVHASDGGWGWVVTFSSFMINVFIDGVTITFGIFFPEFLRYFGESKGKTQLLHSSMIGTLLVFGPVVSALVNKYGGRRAAGSGAVIASVGLFLSLFSPNLDVMIIFYSIVGGIGLGLLYVPPVVMVGLYFNKRRALATGIAVCGAGVGAFVFAPLSEFLLETYGWRGTMWILSALTLNCLIFSATYRPLKPAFDSSVTTNIKTDDYDQDHHVTNSEGNSELCCRQLCSSVKAMFDFSLLKSPTMLMYEASCFLVMLGFYIPPNFLPAWAIDVNLSTEEGALLILSMGVSSTVMRVVIGYITDKSWANSLIINNTALVIGGVSTFFVPFYTTFVNLAAYAAVFGAVTASFTCLRSILMAELFGVQRLSSSLGLVGVSMGLATFVGSPIAGALSDTSGSYNIAFYFGGITLGFGGLICLPLRWISKWEKNRGIDLNIHIAHGADENDDIKNVKALSIKKRTSIYTISEG